MTTSRTVYLTPPRISAAHIKEKIVCIRAHRERIFNVSAQQLDGKYLFHNYGQGGAGWTFLFGCVDESVRQFEQQLEQHPSLRNEPVAVIGAGCYGLLTAITLARNGHRVRIIAQEVETSSYKAAGFFFPRHRKCSTPQERALFASYGMQSYAAYLSIIRGEHPFITAGPKLLPAYYGLDIDPGFALYIEQGLIAGPEQVIVDFGNGKQFPAREYKTVFIDATVMLQQLNHELQRLGIAITRAQISVWSAVAENIIFNCAGLGAKLLTDDKRIVPVQGHLMTLKDQPSMDQLNYMINVKVTMVNANGQPRDELIYYAPKGEGVLGITFIRGQDSLTANQHEFDRLLQRCQDFFG